MLLHDAGIRDAMAAGEIQISPYDKTRLQPSSVDMTLGNMFRVMNRPPVVIDVKEDNSAMMDLLVLDDDEYLDLMPNDFILASTKETIALNNQHAARVEGKSSLGRLGLLVHATAGFIDPGFYGEVTLELANLTPVAIRLYPGMPIAQVAIFRMAGPCENPYGSSSRSSKYAGQSGPTASRYHQNFL